MLISATVLTCNSARLIFRVLDALRALDEVVVLDSGSTDETLEIAAQFPNVRIHKTIFKGFGLLHNEAVDLARNDWIFSIDSDEVVTPELLAELQSARLDAGAVYSVPLRNYYDGQWIRHCGWYPDRHVRIFNRRRTRFTDAHVHEGVITKGMRVVLLRAPMLHFSYSCSADFLKKIQRYSSLFAEQNAGRKNSSLKKAVSRSAWAFFKTYFLQRGFLSGRAGFVIAAANSQGVFYKYVKLAEANRGLSARVQSALLQTAARARTLKQENNTDSEALSRS